MKIFFVLCILSAQRIQGSKDDTSRTLAKPTTRSPVFKEDYTYHARSAKASLSQFQGDDCRSYSKSVIFDAYESVAYEKSGKIVPYRSFANRFISIDKSMRDECESTETISFCESREEYFEGFPEGTTFLENNVTVNLEGMLLCCGHYEYDFSPGEQKYSYDCASIEGGPQVITLVPVGEPYDDYFYTSSPYQCHFKDYFHQFVRVESSTTSKRRVDAWADGSSLDISLAINVDGFPADFFTDLEFEEASLSEGFGQEYRMQKLPGGHK